MDSGRKKIITAWLITGAVLVFFMVAVGGITRLTHSGLSMTDWNLVMGSVPPLSEEAWQSSFDAYKESPEFKEINSHFDLEEYKSIFWWEYIHRMLGRFIGVVFLIPFLYFLWKKWLSPKLTKRLVVLFFLGGFQAFLGWFMVKSGLKDVPRVSHFRLAAHLITAFIACSYIFWLILETNFPRRSSVSHYLNWHKQLYGLLAVIVVQILYGAFVAGLKAGWVHNTWPLMDGQLVSDAVFAMDPLWQNFVDGKSGVQFVHRTLAIVVFVWVVVFYVKAIRTVADPMEVLSARLLFITVLLQVGLGVATLMLQVPIELGILHQLGALLVLLSAIFCIHRYKPISS